MAENQKRILEMLAEKKISVDEALRLLSLVKPEAGAAAREPGEGKSSPKYLHVTVTPAAGAQGSADQVNVRVPMSLIRAGVKFTSLIPPDVYQHMDESLKEKGVNFDLRKISPENIEELVAALVDLEVDIHNGKESVRVFAE
jgi:hypothetical protein